MLELSHKDVEAVIIKMLQQLRSNTVEKNRKIESLTQEMQLSFSIYMDFGSRTPGGYQNPWMPTFLI